MKRIFFWANFAKSAAVGALAAVLNTTLFLATPAPTWWIAILSLASAIAAAMAASWQWWPLWRSAVIRRVVTPAYLALLRKDPKFVPVEEFATLQPEQGEVGAIVPTEWQEIDGCRIRTCAKKGVLIRVFVDSTAAWHAQLTEDYGN